MGVQMKTEQSRWSADQGWQPPPSAWGLGDGARVVYIFGNPDPVSTSKCLDLVRRTYPNAHVIGCSTSGEIHDTSVTDNSVTLTAVAFEHSHVATSRVRIDGPDRSFDAGQTLIRQLASEGLRHVFVLSEGLKVNASELVKGIDSALPENVTISGGCAGDGNRLQNTHVWCDGEPEQSAAVALGLYGDRLNIGVAAIGGWKPFGPDRVITRSKGNVLYEFDGHPALALYKQYLGKYAEGLPASGLMFPLELRLGDGQQSVLRALLAVDDAEQSITFAGDVPEGARARFMLGRIEDLISGTHFAAKETLTALGEFPPQLSLLVSCNGRRYVMKQRTEEEVEAVREALGSGPLLTGFYSYGEIAPAKGGASTELHNETMTITSISER
jgi:hypothetical protein